MRIKVHFKVKLLHRRQLLYLFGQHLRVNLQHKRVLLHRQLHQDFELLNPHHRKLRELDQLYNKGHQVDRHLLHRNLNSNHHYHWRVDILLQLHQKSHFPNNLEAEQRRVLVLLLLLLRIMAL